MTCVACRAVSREWLCAGCLMSLAPAPDRLLHGVWIRSGFVHEGAARVIVHRLKYEAMAGIARQVAVVMADLVPDDCTGLIPVRRTTMRHWRYGIDPARDLGHAVAQRRGLPVIDVLGPPLWWAARAGTGRHHRGAPRFAATTLAPAGAVLIDDVATTGATLAAAAAVTGCRRAVTLTAAAPSRVGGSYG